MPLSLCMPSPQLSFISGLTVTCSRTSQIRKTHNPIQSSLKLQRLKLKLSEILPSYPKITTSASRNNNAKSVTWHWIGLNYIDVAQVKHCTNTLQRLTDPYHNAAVTCPFVHIIVRSHMTALTMPHSNDTILRNTAGNKEIFYRLRPFIRDFLVN
ncbi:hypothetical protein Sbal625DRAFT_4250 [Shewanella baltica OS625]|nr:hypothetical protein Sbal625DRAFT_4250 [Shewanella baltica OS625]